MTKQRELVMKIVKTSPEHMTAEEIFARAVREMPTIVRATVYNNLNALVEAGEIARVEVANGPNRYDKTVTRHFHLLCDICGEMVDAEGIPDLVGLLTRKYGVSVRDVEVNAHYICDACRAKQSK